MPRSMIQLGLQRISRLLDGIPLPWRALHIAGTNGKGSICAYISGMLDVYNASEYRRRQGQPEIVHGRFTSPHLIDRWDCISTGTGPISKVDFEAIEASVLARNVDGAIGASQFELLTATAFEAFTRHAVDIGVVEVGMGGRLDATNVIGQPVIANASTSDFENNDSSKTREAHTGSAESGYRPSPLVTVISRIGMDHQAFLGDTVQAIATEKAGIIKPGVPVVYDHQNESEICEVIEEAARLAGSPIVTWANVASSGILKPLSYAPFKTHQSTTDWENIGSSFFQSLIDHVHAQKYVKANTSVALRAALTALQRLQRIPCSSEHGIDGLHQLVHDMAQVPSRTRVPGRQEYINLERLTGGKQQQPALLDGAHNAQSAQVLAYEVATLRGSSPASSKAHSPITWVVAATDTKDVKEILSPLLSSVDSVFAVEFAPVEGMPWIKPMKSSIIIHAVRDMLPDVDPRNCHDWSTDVSGALKAACATGEIAPQTQVVVVGSLYLVSQVHRLLRDTV